MDKSSEQNANDASTNDARHSALRYIFVNKKALKWTLLAFVVAILVIGVTITLVILLPKHKSQSPPQDQDTESRSPQPEYTEALHKALLFFNAQKSGKLPEDNGITWRGDSGLEDGSDVTDVKGGLVGGYYDAGDNTKFHFPMSFAMTMLSWSVIEYGHKYKSINEYDHARELIKWGTDYLFRTFNSSSSKIDHIYGQVGGSQKGSAIPDDQNCWEKPEDMDYNRPTQIITLGADLAGEMTAALAAASIVFKDNNSYSKKLLQGAATVWAFARDPSKRSRYSKNNLFTEPCYNFTGYFDEYLWGDAWMYYATGNASYLSLVMSPVLDRNCKSLVGQGSKYSKRKPKG